MLLSHPDLAKAILNGELLIDPPPDPGSFQPASIDLCVGPTFATFREAFHTIPPRRLRWEDVFQKVTYWHVPLVLPPGAFALGHTMETIHIGLGLAGRLEGKSSVGRAGLLVHCTAGFIDPGFQGELTLELLNATPYPLVVKPGMRICQLSVLRLSTPLDEGYGAKGYRSHYQGQTGPRYSAIEPGDIIGDPT